MKYVVWGFIGAVVIVAIVCVVFYAGLVIQGGH